MSEIKDLVVELEKAEMLHHTGGFLFGPPTPVYLPPIDIGFSPEASAAGGGETFAASSNIIR